MKTAEEVQETEVLSEVDDFRFAQMIVSEQQRKTKFARMWYMAKWVARLREHYVAIGRDAEAAEAPPRSCQKCTDAAGCHSQGQCVYTGYPLRKTA